MAAIKRPEQNLQINVCQFLDRALRPSWRYWATYNNAHSKAQGGINKAMGVKAGFPDLCVAGPSKGSLYLIGIELKVGSRKPSPAQRDWHDWMILTGADCFVCTSLIDVEAALRMAGVPIRATAGEG